MPRPVNTLKQIMAAIRRGRRQTWGTGDLIARLRKSGCTASDKQICNQLYILTQVGLIKRCAKGTYQVTTTPVTLAKEPHVRCALPSQPDRNPLLGP